MDGAMSPPPEAAGREPAETVPVRVWDIWVRLGHWAVVVLLGLSWWTGKAGLMSWHMWSGYAMLVLLLFRLAWGFLGSETARFRGFLVPPRAALRHLAAEFRRPAAPDMAVGHGAAGGWMVLALLGLLLFQAVSGLFADDEELYRGPLAELVGFDAAQRITGLHQRNFNLILAAAALHVAAILAYRLVLGRDLVRPMITGVKRLPRGAVAARGLPRMGRPALAAALLLTAAGLVLALARPGGGGP